MTTTPWPPPTGAPEGTAGWYRASDGAWYQSDEPPAAGWSLGPDGIWFADPDELWRSSRWGLGDAWWGLVVYLVASTILVVAVVATTGNDVTTDPFVVAALVLGNAAAFLGVPWWASRRKGTRSMRRDFGLWGRPVDLAIGFGCGLGGLVAAGLVGTLVDAAFGNDEPTSNLPVEDLVGATEIIVFFVAVAVVTPLIEEVFFRGLIHRSFLKRGTSPVWSAVWTTAIFVVPHLSAADGWSRLASLAVSIGVLGAAFQLASHLTGNRLAAPIVAHFVVNGTAAVVLAFG